MLLIALLALLIVAGSAAFLSVPPRQLDRKLFSPVGLFFVSVTVVFVPRLAYLLMYFDRGDALLARGMERAEFFPAAVIVMVSLIGAIGAFWAGTMLFARDAGNIEPVGDDSDVDWDAVPVLVLAFGGLGLLAWLLFLVSVGGDYWGVVLNPATRQLSNAGSGYIKAATRLLPLTLILFYWRECHLGRQRWYLIAPATAAVVAVMLVFGQRQEVFAPLLSMVVMRHLAYKPFRPLPMIATGLALLAGITIFVAFRSTTSSVALDSPLDAARLFPAAASEVFDSPASSMNQATKAFTSVDSYFLVASKYDRLEAGRTYLGVLLQPIPSALWPGKKGSYEAPGGIVSRLYLPTVAAGTPPTLFGELRMNFGWLGMFVMMIWIGAAFGTAQRLALHNWGNPLVSLWLAAYAPGIFLFVWGAANIWASKVLLLLVPMTIATVVLRNPRETAGEVAAG